MMATRHEIGTFATSVGSMTTNIMKRLLEGGMDEDDETPSDEDEVPDDMEMDEIHELFGLSAIKASVPMGVSASQLSKVWKIDYKQALNTLKATTQLLKRSNDTKLI